LGEEEQLFAGLRVGTKCRDAAQSNEALFMLSRMEWIPPPRPETEQSIGEVWLARVTVTAGVCLVTAGFLASLY
jgi:hypothetical protein